MLNMVLSECRRSRSQRGFTLVELLVVIAIIGALAAMLMPAVSGARASGKKAACINNLRQLGIALELHNNTHGAYPLDGENGYGLAVFLLPFLEEQPLYDQINPKRVRPVSPSNGNSNPGDTSIKILVCPSFARPQGGQAAAGLTNYLGNDSLFSAVRIYDDITDGESKTIAMGETTSSHPWMSPGLAGPTPPNNGGNYGSRHEGGGNFLFCDGSVQFVVEDIDPAVFAALCTIDGGEPVSGW